MASTRWSTPSGAEMAEGTIATVGARKATANAKPTPRSTLLFCMIVIKLPVVAGGPSLVRDWPLFWRIPGYSGIGLYLAKQFHLVIRFSAFSLLTIDSGQSKMGLSREVRIIFNFQEAQPGFDGKCVVTVEAGRFAEQVKSFRHILFNFVGLSESSAGLVKFTKLHFRFS